MVFEFLLRTSDSSLQLLSSPPSQDPRLPSSAHGEPSSRDASLGQYLQPAAQLSYEETDEEEVVTLKLVLKIRSHLTLLKQVRPSSAAIADLDRLYAQFSTSETEDTSSGQEERGEQDNTKNFLGWEKLLAKAEAEAPDSFYQDPSFCSGKITARFTLTTMHI